MGKRPGRKRNQDVRRHPGGQIDDYAGREMPQNVAGNSDLIWRGDERGKKYLYRPTVLDKIGLTDSQIRAGEAFAALRDSCARYSWGSRQLTPKVSSPHRGKSNAPELDPERVVSLGEKFHVKYLETIRGVQDSCPRGALGVMVSVCLENKVPTSERNLLILRNGLSYLANKWGL